MGGFELSEISRRKVCFVFTSLIHYSRLKPLIDKLHNDANVELQLVVLGGALLHKYGDLLNVLQTDGYAAHWVGHSHFDGLTGASMAKSAASAMSEATTAFQNLKPDIVVIRGDRSELLGVVASAVYMNIFVIHVEGGDLSGNIDESVRHAITKLSHFHLVTNEASKKIVCSLGENPNMVENVGALEFHSISEKISQISAPLLATTINSHGVGADIDISSKYIVVMYHPDTFRVNMNDRDSEELILAINTIGLQTVWFWPNNDSGSEFVSRTIRKTESVITLRT